MTLPGDGRFVIPMQCSEVPWARGWTEGGGGWGGFTIEQGPMSKGPVQQGPMIIGNGHTVPLWTDRKVKNKSE